jgi:hypothetical protein
MRCLIAMMICLALLSACKVATYRYQSEQNGTQWVGKNINALISQWGTADQVLHASNGTSYYAYTTNTDSDFFNSTVSNFSTTPGFDDPSMNLALPNVNASLQCVTVFKTNAKDIITYIWHQGSNCGGEWVPNS